MSRDHLAGWNKTAHSAVIKRTGGKKTLATGTRTLRTTSFKSLAVGNWVVNSCGGMAWPRGSFGQLSHLQRGGKTGMIASRKRNEGPFVLTEPFFGGWGP